MPGDCAPGIAVCVACQALTKQEKTDDSFNLNRRAHLASARDSQIRFNTMNNLDPDIDSQCFDVLDSPRDAAAEDLRALALAGSQLAAQWLAETDGMASHEWADWLASEPS